jgi:hypothetical protein
VLVQAEVQIREGIAKRTDLPAILSEPVVLCPQEVDVAQGAFRPGQPGAEERSHGLDCYRSSTTVGEADPRAEDAASLEHAVDDICCKPGVRVNEADP